MRRIERAHLVFVLLFWSVTSTVYSQSPVYLEANTGSRTTIMENGDISVYIDSKGQVTSMEYWGINLLDNGGKIYFSYNDIDTYLELSPGSLKVVKANDDYAEVVYSSTSGNLKVDQGYIMRKGVSGLYSYVVLRGSANEVTVREMRLGYRVDPDLFDYGYVTDQMQGYLPTVAVMQEVDDQAIMDATYPLPDGTIYTKYNWAHYIDQDSVHGMMSNGDGVWAINPSNEYMNGGPMKQELTVHATNKTPIILQMLQGEHFGSSAQTFGDGDEKIYGPFFIYVNSGSSHEAMVEDAQAQAGKEKDAWPYSWFSHSLYPQERTTVNGRICLPWDLSSDKVTVALSQPGSDFYMQGTGYMYWDKSGADRKFSIKGVRPGTYTLSAFAGQGEVTDVYTEDITVSGSSMDLGYIRWPVVKLENLLWQIGESDRKSDGFNMSDEARAYGLYDLPPANLTYTVGTSTPGEDWYYAQTKTGKWTVAFNCDESYSGDAILTTAIAGATSSPTVEVYVNNVKKDTWSFGNDAAIYRSAVLGGKYDLKTITFPASELVVGQNTIDFKMTSVGSRGGIMYDIIKLEAGAEIVPEFTAVPTLQVSSEVLNYPNPFTDRINFRFDAPVSDDVRLSIYNIQGKLMDRVEFTTPNGREEISWENTQLPAGLYLYRIENGVNVYSGLIQKQ